MFFNSGSAAVGKNIIIIVIVINGNNDENDNINSNNKLTPEAPFAFLPCLSFGLTGTQMLRYKQSASRKTRKYLD